MTRLRATAALGALLLFPAELPACECAPPAFEQRVKDAERIFIGEVQHVSEPLLPWNKQDPHEVRLLISEAFKGEGGGITVMDHWFCGYLFGEKKKYLVFASRDEKGNYHVYSTCSGSVPVPEKEYPRFAEELRRLRELRAGVH